MEIKSQKIIRKFEGTLSEFEQSRCLRWVQKFKLMLKEKHMLNFYEQQEQKKHSEGFQTLQEGKKQQNPIIMPN